MVSGVAYNSMLKEPVAWNLGGNQVSVNRDADGLLTSFIDSGVINQAVSTDNEGHVVSSSDSASGNSFAVSLTSNYAIQSGTINSKTLSYNVTTNKNMYSQQDGITNISYTLSYGNNKLAGMNDNITNAYTTYQYDANGNTTLDNRGNYTYDLKNNMTSSTRTLGGVTSTGTYSFNALGQRVIKNVGGQSKFFVYNNNNQLIGEYDSSGNAIAEYVYFGMRPVAVKNGSNINIVHTDYLGTPRVVTNGGSTVWQWKNDNPYGYNQALGNIEFNLRFAGQYYDSESGSHYNIYRTYNPEIGRYMQSDPIGLAGGFNTYNYAERNPLSAIDPDGHNPIAIAVIGAIAGGISNGLNYYSQGKDVSTGILIGAAVGGSSALIETAWIAGAVGGAGTQLLNRIAGVNLFDTGHPIKDCAAEIAITAGVGVAFGKIFDSIAVGQTMSSANVFIRSHLDTYRAAIANAYSTSYNNLLNAYTNLGGVLR